MAAIEAKASPLKPLEVIENKSSADLILDVAWRSKANLTSLIDIPIPLSIT